MRRFLKILVILLLLMLVLAAALVCKVLYDRHIQELDQAAMEKSDEALLGERISISRAGKTAVPANWYEAAGDGARPPPARRRM